MNTNHRELAVSFFNEAWSLLDLTERNSEQNARMSNLAHASLLHWSYVGTPKNLAIGEWQVARIHAVLKQTVAAEFHARRSLELAQAHELGPFLIAYAHEALARALAVQNPALATQHRELALGFCNQIPELDSRRQLLEDLQTICIQA